MPLVIAQACRTRLCLAGNYLQISLHNLLNLNKITYLSTIESVRSEGRRGKDNFEVAEHKLLFHQSLNPFLNAVTIVT